MRFSELFLSGKQKQNRGHFANIVKIAKADDKITEEEQLLLLKIANRLNISVSNFTRILDNPESYPINPPASYEERIHRLYTLTEMVLVDGEVANEEIKLLQKLIIGLGFSSNKIEQISKQSIELVKTNTDLKDFILEIKKVNYS